MAGNARKALEAKTSKKVVSGLNAKKALQMNIDSEQKGLNKTKEK